MASKAILVVAALSGAFSRITFHQLVKAASISPELPMDTAACSADIDACGDEAECSVCLSGWGEENSSIACEDRFPAFTDGLPCEQQGASFCCNLGDESTASDCMDNSLFVTFWTCFMENFGCSVEDMPCYNSGNFSAPSSSSVAAPTSYLPTPSMAVSGSPSEVPSAASPSAAPSAASSSAAPSAVSHSAAPSDTPPSTASSATSQPSASPSTYSSSMVDLASNRGLNVTTSPTAFPSTASFEAAVPLANECAIEMETCMGDEVCQSCYYDVAKLVGGSAEGKEGGVYDCLVGYLGVETAADEATSTCELVDSAYCCRGGADEAEPANCLANANSTAYWECVFDYFACSMEEATCLGFDEGSFRSDDDVSLSIDNPGEGKGAENGAAASTSEATFSAGRSTRFVYAWCSTGLLAVASAGGAAIM